MALPIDCERVYLIGPRGAGKTSVGRLLAERLGWRFVDTDDEVERLAGQSIAQVFADKGVDTFRTYESAALAACSGDRYIVVGTGGGAVLSAPNRSVLGNGFVVWLAAPAGTLQARIDADPLSSSRRPALTAIGGLAEMARIIAEREPLYRGVAHLTVDTAGLSPAAVVSSILA